MTQIQLKLPWKKITLPSYEWSEVIIRKITVGEQREIRKKYNVNSKSDMESDETTEAMLAMVASCIESRNFMIGEEPLLVSIEALEQMPNEDVTFLIGETLWIKTDQNTKND